MRSQTKDREGDNLVDVEKEVYGTRDEVENGEVCLQKPTVCENPNFSTPSNM